MIRVHTLSIITHDARLYANDQHVLIVDGALYYMLGWHPKTVWWHAKSFYWQIEYEEQWWDEFAWWLQKDHMDEPKPIIEPLTTANDPDFVFFECAKCDEELNSYETRFKAANEVRAERGWIARKNRNDQWYHLCPKCKRRWDRSNMWWEDE